MKLFLELGILFLVILFYIMAALIVIASIKALFELRRRQKKKEKIRQPISGDPSKVDNWYLYILKLEDRKYYVGITSKTPEIRMKEHRDGVRTAYWTAKHKPIELIYSEDLGLVTRRQAERQENKLVRACIKERGLNNVRGGDLTSVDEYIQRFGYVFDKDSWTELTMMVCLMTLLIYFMVDKFFL